MRGLGKHSPIRHRPPVSIDPTRQIAYARSNQVPAAIWIFIILVGLIVLKEGHLPTASQTLTWAILAVVVVGSATIAPELVTALLLAALVLAVLTNVPFVSEILDSFGKKVDELAGLADTGWRSIPQLPQIFGGA